MIHSLRTDNRTWLVRQPLFCFPVALVSRTTQESICHIAWECDTNSVNIIDLSFYGNFYNFYTDTALHSSSNTKNLYTLTGQTDKYEKSTSLDVLRSPMQSANPPEQQPVQYEDLDPIPMQEIRIPPEPMLIIATRIPSLKPVEVVVKKWPLSKLPRIPENHPEGRSVQSNDPKLSCASIANSSIAMQVSRRS